MATTAPAQKSVTLEDLFRYLDEERKERIAAQAALAESIAAREAAEAQREKREAARIAAAEAEAAEREAARIAAAEAAAKAAAAERKAAREAEMAAYTATRAKERAEDAAAWRKTMGELSNRLGDVAEYMFDTENILRCFGDLGYFIERSTRNMRIVDSAGKYIAEFDITLHNGVDVVLIEVKTHAAQRDVDWHIERITRVKERNTFPGKTLIGGIASPVLHDEVKNYAIKHGLYVIEHVAEEIEVLPADKNFQPRRW